MKLIILVAALVVSIGFWALALYGAWRAING
jgi:hypothetical protein